MFNMALDSKFVERAHPGELLNAIKKLKLKNKIGGRFFDHDSFLNGADGFTPTELIYAGRRQLKTKIAGLREYARERVEYFYNVQLVKEGVRQIIADNELVAHTLVPGPKRHRFPKGTTFYPMESLQALTVTMRRGKPEDKVILDRFFVRAHTMELNRDSGEFFLGGSGTVDDKPFSRTVLSRDFCREPGRDPRAVPGERKEVTRAAIAGVQALEIAAVSHYPRQRMPVFPRVYMAFDNNEIPRFDTSALQKRAAEEVFRWIQRGLPMELGARNGAREAQNSIVQRLSKLNVEEIGSWSDLSSILDSADVGFLLDWSLDKSIVQHDGLYLVPAAFFPPDGVKEMLPELKQLFVRMDRSMGREIMLDDGSIVRDPRLARVQITTGHDCLVGRSGDLTYDLTSTEVGREAEFAS